MSRIVKVETWISRDPAGLNPGAYPGSFGKYGSETVVLRIVTDEGVEGIATSLAVPSPNVSLTYINEIIAPRLIGRDVHDREAIWQDFWSMNRKLAFFPIYLPGPIDVALWDIASKEAGLPLHKYLGSYRDRVPVYASGQFMPTQDDYLEEIAKYKALGVTAYKAHPSGTWRDHIALAERMRAEFPDMVFMLDPVYSNYTMGEAVQVGRALERLGFHWLEEPFDDFFVAKYAELSRTLDIPVAATEATYGGPAGMAEFLRLGAADIVRADVSWRWGITGCMKASHAAEAFGVNCELHTTAMGLLDVANLHVACAMKNSEYHELFAPHEAWRFPLDESNAPELDADGNMVAPTKPGMGVEINWDALDNSAVNVITASA